MKRLSISVLCALLLWACGGKSAPAPAVAEKPEKIAREPSVQIMPNVKPEMLTAGYWIARSDYPDRLIMTPEEISVLNSQTAATHKLVTVSEFQDTLSGKVIAARIKTISANVKGLYTPDNIQVSGTAIDKIMSKAGLDRLGSANHPVRFGIITENTPQRLIPSEIVLMRRNGSAHFDRLQMSTLETGDPVAVLWQSTDGEWLYVQSSHTEGWVPLSNVAFCGRKDIIAFENPSNFVVTVRPKTSVYLNAGLTEYYSWLPLGSVVIRDSRGNLTLPVRSSAGRLVMRTVFIEDSYLHQGYLPYTSRNMLTLAFEMLNAPYGWGGMYGEQDCSAYLMRIFGAAGITLPRNSAQQGRVGEAIYPQKSDKGFTSRQALYYYGVAGATVIQFPGHIMLYVGSEKAEPYVIHAIWAFMALESDSEGGDESVLKLPARVVLSDLNLSAHTERGSYINRTTNIRNIKAVQPAK